MIVSAKNVNSLLHCQSITDSVYCCEVNSFRSCCDDENMIFHFISDVIQSVLDASDSLDTIAEKVSTFIMFISCTFTVLSSASLFIMSSTLSFSMNIQSVSSQAVSSSTAAFFSDTVIDLSVDISLVVVTAVSAFEVLFFHRWRQQKMEPQQEHISEMPVNLSLISQTHNELSGMMELRELTAERSVMMHMK